MLFCCKIPSACFGYSTCGSAAKNTISFMLWVILMVSSYVLPNRDVLAYSTVRTTARSTLLVGWSHLLYHTVYNMSFGEGDPLTQSKTKWCCFLHTVHMHDVLYILYQIHHNTYRGSIYRLLAARGK